MGAGLSGLVLGQKLQRNGKKVLILEKSRGLGGRMATRRVGESELLFDHGAQFIRHNTETSYLLDLLKETDFVREELLRADQEVLISTQGMTQFAKDLASDLEIVKGYQVTKIATQGLLVEVSSFENPTFVGHRVVLTLPVPQSVELLNQSGFGEELPQELLKIKYAKSIVFLIDTPVDYFFRAMEGSDILSITNQSFKFGLSKPATTVIMSPSWSDKWFSCTDEEIRNAFLDVKEIQQMGVKNSSLRDFKKWRYSQPLQIFSSAFYSPVSRVYCIGDGFSGPSLNGAIRSAAALFNELFLYK